MPVVTNDAGGAANVQYSGALAPPLTISATDADTDGSRPDRDGHRTSGRAVARVSTSPAATLPGVRTWTVAGNTTAAPASYPVTVTVTDRRIA